MSLSLNMVGLCWTTVGRKTNFPADRPNPVATFMCAGPLLPWNSAGMSGTHANLQGNSLSFLSWYFWIFFILHPRPPPPQLLCFCLMNLFLAAWRHTNFFLFFKWPVTDWNFCRKKSPAFKYDWASFFFKGPAVRSRTKALINNFCKLRPSNFPQ